MSRVVPFSEILEREDGEPLSAVKGTLKAIYKQKTGPKKDGSQWQIQDCEFTDGKTVIKIFNTGPEIDKSWQGRAVMLECKKGDKGLSGVYAFDDEYNSVITRKIKLTPTAIVSLLDEHGNSVDDAPPPQRQPSQESQPSQSRTTTASAPGGLAFATKRANQVANLLMLSAVKAETYLAPRLAKKLGREITAEETKAHTATIFIQLAKENCVMQMHEIEYPLKDAAPPPPRQPREEAPPEHKPAPPPPERKEVAPGVWGYSDGNDGLPEGTPLDKDGNAIDDIPF